MKIIFAIFLVLIFAVFSTLVMADTIWWDAERTEMVMPEVVVLERGLALYGCLENGAIYSGKGYLDPGTWKLLMKNNPSIILVANSLVPGPRYEIWEEQISFPTQNRYWLLKHYMFRTNEIGAWVDHGGGAQPLYMVYYKKIFISDSRYPFFESASDSFRLLYNSAADVDSNGKIDILDLQRVCLALNRSNPKKVKEGDSRDVDGDLFIDADDLDIIVQCWEAYPDIPADEAIPYIKGKIIYFSQLSIESQKKATTWGRIKGF